jgi:multiple sugar transport system substrate-binding protein
VNTTKLSRRKFIGLSAVTVGAGVLSACAANPAAPPAAAPAAQAPAAAPEATDASAAGTAANAVKLWQVPLEQPVDIENYDAFFALFDKADSSVKLEKEFIGYGDMLDKLRVAVRGGGGPNVATLPILWGVEFAANGFLRPLKPEELGYSKDTFWPLALNSCKWEGETYGVPTNNECMALIINKDLFEKVGADPEKGPQTWEELAEISNKMKTDLDIAGFGMVARLNHGNTPFRFMPLVWAYGGGALDELEESPTMSEVRINSPQTREALALYKKMYVDDKSVPQGALDNTQTENRELFINEKIAMMISHPSEVATIRDKNPAVADKMNYVLLPSGPVRRAAVYGGSNIHVFKNTPEEAMPAVLDYVKLRTNPEWTNRLNWNSSNPGNREGFKHPLFEERLKQIPFLNVTTEMLNYGVPFPVIPEATEIMNLIVPTMIHNTLTGTMTVEQASDDAAKKISDILAKRPK